MRRLATGRLWICVAALLATGADASPVLAGKGDMIDKSTIMLEGILKSVEDGKVLEPGLLFQVQAEVDQNNPMAMYVLGWYRLKRNQWDSALPLLQKSAELDYIRAQLTLAQAALSQREFANARQWIDRARANPFGPLYAINIGKLEEVLRVESENNDKALLTAKFLDLSKEAMKEPKPDKPESEATSEPAEPVVKPAAAEETPETAAAEGCAKDLAAVKDPDVDRNAELMRKARLCYREERFKDAGLSWKLSIIENPAETDGPHIAVPHDNEDSAFDTAVYVVARYGGRVVAVQAGEQRILARIQDPNRAFGKGKSCKALKRPAPVYTEKMIKLLDGGRYWFALHTNDPGHAQSGGQGTISAALTVGQSTGFVNPDAKGAFADPDNAVVISGAEPATDAGAIGWRNRIQGLGLNVIYEQVEGASNDCSLSNYLVLNRRAGLGSYFNIEVTHGQTQTQKKMADLLLGMLGFRKAAVVANKAKP